MDIADDSDYLTRNVGELRSEQAPGNDDLVSDRTFAGEISLRERFVDHYDGR